MRCRGATGYALQTNTNMKQKSYRLTISASVVELEDGKVVVDQELAFDGRAPAVHHAIANMGPSFVYGLGVSLSTHMAAESEGDSEKKPKVA